ncbi:MAG: hypothetical protein P8Z75_12400, partial [Gammaproteobacteria bacterium]
MIDPRCLRLLRKATGVHVDAKTCVTVELRDLSGNYVTTARIFSDRTEDTTSGKSYSSPSNLRHYLIFGVRVKTINL